MAERSAKTMNLRELALAARFIEALDLSTASDLVDPIYLTESRLFVRVVGEGTVQKDAERLAREVDGLRVLGLPIRRLEPGAGRSHQATALKVENRLPFTLVNVDLKAGDSAGAPIVPFSGVGVAPGRSSVVSIQAPSGKVDHVELNGL